MAMGSRPLRRRGRWWLGAGLIATIVVLAVNTAMSARSPAPARELAKQSYLDQVLPAVEQSTQEGKDIDTVRTQALTLGVTTINGRLQEVTANADQTLAQVRRLKPPTSLQTAHDLLVATLAMRADGADAFRRAMAGAISGRGSASPVQEIIDVGRDFDAGDRAYALFAKAMPLTAPMPASQWLTNPVNYSATEVASFLAGLKSAASLAPVHDLSVVLVTTDPAAVSSSPSSEVLPISKILDLQIVVANLGNQSEKKLTVTATIAPSASGPSQMVRDFADLSPGQRRTVRLGGLRAQPGTPTTLTIKIDSVTGETNTADNTKVIAFVMQ
jgi:hypothetical protein